MYISSEEPVSLAIHITPGLSILSLFPRRITLVLGLFLFIQSNISPVSRLSVLLSINKKSNSTSLIPSTAYLQLEASVTFILPSSSKILRTPSKKSLEPETSIILIGVLDSTPTLLERRVLLYNSVYLYMHGEILN